MICIKCLFRARSKPRYADILAYAPRLVHHCQHHTNTLLAPRHLQRTWSRARGGHENQQTTDSPRDTEMAVRILARVQIGGQSILDACGSAILRDPSYCSSDRPSIRPNPSLQPSFPPSAPHPPRSVRACFILMYPSTSVCILPCDGPEVSFYVVSWTRRAAAKQVDLHSLGALQSIHMRQNGLSVQLGEDAGSVHHTNRKKKKREGKLEGRRTGFLSSWGIRRPPACPPERPILLVIPPAFPSLPLPRSALPRRRWGVERLAGWLAGWLGWAGLG
ncbi:hypothetical protein IWX91DRAFT_404058 [Phyllosticta citricarpa]